jgi:hypothetical protein
MKLPEIEAFFNSIELPTEPINLNVTETIIDCKKFVKSHLEYLKGQKGNKVYLPYYNRLIQLYKILKK